MTWPLVNTLVRRAELASTSDLARELVLAGGVALPLLVRADRQTRGRGRGSNAWWSDAGSLTMTLAIDPQAHGLTPAHEPRLALAAAVALVEAVAPFVPTTEPLGIRWPNDVEAGGRKLGGVLPERVETPSGACLLVGIGLNVLTRLVDAPPEVRAMAASLAGWGDPPGLDAVLTAWLARFEAILPRLARDDPELAARWAELDTLRGRSVRVNQETCIRAGVGGGIDAEGALLLWMGNEILRVFGGQIVRDV
jgi:BirA family transcriptional regulator, biotin operon repressor / biotin---[acetyl-CoA-carboxylase] ligase